MSSKPQSPIVTALFGAPLVTVPELVPGVILAVVVALVGDVLSGFLGTQVLGFDQSPISPIMLAIFLGMLVANLVKVPPVVQPGVRFGVRKLLRLGIILLGIRLSLLDVAKVGAYGVPVVALCITAGLVFASLFARWLKLPERLGTLIAVGTGICGLSAIIATAPTIEASDEEVAYAAADITIFGAIVAFAYPYLAHTLFAGDPVRTGLFLGTAVHDTSQVVAAGLIHDQAFGAAGALAAADVAVIIKMVRNVFMAVVVPLMAYRYARQQAQAMGSKVRIASLLPMFVLGFIAMAALRSLGDANLQAGGAALGIWSAPQWTQLVAGIKAVAEFLLLVALSAMGLSTRFDFLRHLGLRPFIAGLLAALLVGLVSAGTAALLGGLIQL